MNCKKQSDVAAPVCEHKWTYIDESFDHDWAGGGCEQSGFWQCLICDEETDKIED